MNASPFLMNFSPLVSIIRDPRPFGPSSRRTVDGRPLADGADLLVAVTLMRSHGGCSRSRARASFSTPSREKTWAPMTTPSTPGGTRSEVSFTSPAFSPKMARRSFSSGESWVSPFGVILPTRMSPGGRRRRCERCRPRRGSERLLADVRDVPGDLFLAELGVARSDLELLDVDRGEVVLAHQALGDEDGVLEVVPLPWHEGDDGVLPERKLAEVGRGPSAMMSPASTRSPRRTTGLLVDAGVLVGPRGTC